MGGRGMPTYLALLAGWLFRVSMFLILSTFFTAIFVGAMSMKIILFIAFMVLMWLGELFTACGIDITKDVVFMQIFIFAAMVLFPIVNHPIFTVFATSLPIPMRMLLLSSYITLMASAAIATIQAVISLIHVRKDES
jgi:hypothetical protein